MNKTAIEWCDYTWNPVTGCLHGCEYCYARNIAKRFSGCYDFASGENIIQNENGVIRLEHTGRLFFKTKNGGTIPAPYPHGFAPTFHRYRLDEPAKMKKPQTIFVCSMADLFGDWVSDEWIQEVFEACEAAPQHRYLFLTKNPERIPLSSFVYSGIFDKHSDNFWFGMSATNQKSLEKRYKHFSNINGNTFLSIEPLLESIDLSRIDSGDVIYDVKKSMGYYLGGGREVQNPKWVIIGAETGNRKGKIVPKRKWIENIVKQCSAADVPVFMKNSLKDIWQGKLIQEYPW